MVVLDTTTKRMNKLVGRRLSVNKLDGVLFDFGMELDKIEGNEIKVEITPDRPDMVSPQGLARALKGYLGARKGLVKYRSKKSDHKFIIHRTVNSVRPFAVACIVKNVKFTSEFIKEIIWVQEKLHMTYCRNRKKAAIGIYPLETISFPVHYKALPPEKIKFVPLGFDEEINGRDILKKHPAGEKYANLLRGFGKYPVIMDSKKEILSMPPIINSQKMGKITNETRDIFIEVTGTHWRTVNQVLTILAIMFADEGATIQQLKTTFEGKKKYYCTPNLEPEKMKLKYSDVHSVIGKNFSKKEIKTLLQRMGYGVSLGKDRATVLVPSYRVDVLHPIDLVDDIARAYGFNNFEPEFPETPTVGNLLPRTEYISRLREIMTGAGFMEQFTFALTTKESQYNRMNINNSEYCVEILESKSPADIVRTWILPELLKCIESNLHHGYPQKYFEAGDIAKIDSSRDVKSSNETHLSFVWADNGADFTNAKQVLDCLSTNFDLKFTLKRKKHPSFIEGRCASVIYKGKPVGIVGTLHPKVLENFKIEVPVVAMELNIEPFLN